MASAFPIIDIAEGAVITPKASLTYRMCGLQQSSTPAMPIGIEEREHDE
jgi:hypothetical protein